MENKVIVITGISSGIGMAFVRVFFEALLTYGNDYILVKNYKNLDQLEEILQEYVTDLDPPKRRFNITLKIKTWKQLNQISNELNKQKRNY